VLRSPESHGAFPFFKNDLNTLSRARGSLTPKKEGLTPLRLALGELQLVTHCIDRWLPTTAACLEALRAGATWRQIRVSMVQTRCGRTKLLTRPQLRGTESSSNRRWG